ncbi:MAG: aspartate ammonia-lyase [Bdellovibrionota bacterium]
MKKSIIKKSMEEFREERDSLGNIKVPQNAIYGAQTARALQNFPISGRTADSSIIRAYLRLKAAAAVANMKCGVLNKSNTDLILHAIDSLLSMPEAAWHEHFPVDPYQAGAGTSQNMNINEVIANQANMSLGNQVGSYSPIHPNDHVNRSQSTNDTFPTVMRLALLERSTRLQEELENLSQEFSKKSKQWMPILKSARTHLQDAVPIRLGQEFGAYSQAIKRCTKWIGQARENLCELGIGGSAAGTGLTVPNGYIPIIIEELAKRTGEKLHSAADLCEAMQSQAPVMYYSSMLRLTAIEITRICNDIRLLSSGPLTGLAEITLPAVQPGSSIMPGKVNPSIVEMTNQTWFSIQGYDQTAALAAQAGQLELNVMMPVMAYSLIEATKIGAASIQSLRELCVAGMKPNEARLKHYFESTPQIATALSPKLGYEVTASLVGEALLSGRSILQLVRERELISEKEIESLLNF